jgi:hypothetical protein
MTPTPKTPAGRALTRADALARGKVLITEIKALVAKAKTQQISRQREK